MNGFKHCNICASDWENLRRFLEDPDIAYHGYQAAFDTPILGLFLFNHLAKSCGTTLTVKLNTFLPSIEAAKFKMAESPDCPGYCKDVTNVLLCPEKQCIGNQIRQLIEKMRTFPKMKK